MLSVVRRPICLVDSMPKKKQGDTLSKVEAAQAALRDSIEKSKELAEESERLIRKHRAEIAKAEPPNPGQ